MHPLLKQAKEKHEAKERENRIKETGIIGYCSCCGAPHYVGKPIEHDKEDHCIFDEED